MKECKIKIDESMYKIILAEALEWHERNDNRDLRKLMDITREYEQKKTSLCSTP